VAEVTDWRTRSIGVRWTIGDVSTFGFDALRWSLWGAFGIFGPHAEYVVCVNSIPIELARERTGRVPDAVRWHDANGDVPAFLRAHFDTGMAEGVGWKFAPLRMYPDRHEIALDNDCILWALPPTLRAWLELDAPASCLLAEDVRACFGQFAPVCGEQPRNSGIRGLPPRFCLEHALRAMLEAHPVRMQSELDEQGLQAAALARSGPLAVVTLDEVAVSSPFPPHLPEPGSCGVHFVGLNAKRVRWRVGGRSAEQLLREHYARWQPFVRARIALE
jgi:hypothetical protein